MRNFSKTIYLSIIFVLIFIGLSRAQISDSGIKEKKSIYFRDNSFFVEVAETKLQQERGLMFVKSLPFNSGMLFVYQDEAPRAFYMKNTYIPLDIIWMDKGRKVVFIKKNAQPSNLNAYETILPPDEAMYVLELNSGSADKIGLSIGDTLRF